MTSKGNPVNQTLKLVLVVKELNMPNIFHDGTEVLTKVQRMAQDATKRAMIGNQTRKVLICGKNQKPELFSVAFWVRDDVLMSANNIGRTQALSVVENLCKLICNAAC